MRLSSLVPLLPLLSTTLAIGSFIYPSGTDGSLTVTTGNTIDISWTNTSDYEILSLGYYSTSNQTITWLISDSTSRPTSYRWTVDAVAKGFNLADSRLFAFYICEGFNFDNPFQSPFFVINDATASTSTTSTSSTRSASTTTSGTSTSSAAAATETEQGTSGAQTSSSVTPTPTGTAASSSSSSSASSSSGLSTGAKAGIAVGAVLGVLGVAAVIAFVIMRRRRRAAQSKTLNQSEIDGAYEKAQTQQQANSAGNVSYDQGDKYAPYTGMHEVVGSQPGLDTTKPVEMGPGAPSQGANGRSELSAGR